MKMAWNLKPKEAIKEMKKIGAFADKAFNKYDPTSGLAKQK